MEIPCPVITDYSIYSILTLTIQTCAEAIGYWLSAEIPAHLYLRPILVGYGSVVSEGIGGDFSGTLGKKDGDAGLPAFTHSFLTSFIHIISNPQTIPTSIDSLILPHRAISSKVSSLIPSLIWLPCSCSTCCRSIIYFFTLMFMAMMMVSVQREGATVKKDLR